MTSRDLTDEKGQFIKSVYDELFTEHPELINEERVTKSWITTSTNNEIIKSYEDRIIDKFGEDCIVTVELPYNKKIRGFDYDTWSYIESCLMPYGYELL